MTFSGSGMRSPSERQLAMGRIAAARSSSPAHKNSWRRGCQLDMVRVWAAAPIGARSEASCAGRRAGRVRRQRMGATGTDQEHRERGDGERSVAVRDGDTGRRAIAARRRYCRSRRSRGARPLRPGARQGFLRRRLHRRHQGTQVPSDRRGRPHHPGQSRAPRRGRRRSARRRRRRNPGADSASILRPEDGGARLCPAGAGRVRDRRAVHAP